MPIVTAEKGTNLHEVKCPQNEHGRDVCGPRQGGLRLDAMLVAALLSSSAFAQQNEAVRASSMLDISGLAWLEQDLFIAVRDGKNNQAEQAHR